MRVSEFLIAIATWLESSDNEALMLAEYNEPTLQAVAKSCVAAATILRQGAVEAEQIEPAAPPVLTPEALDHLNMVISALDKSPNLDLQKSASVIDELLLTIAAPPKWAEKFSQMQDTRLEVLKEQYQRTKRDLDDVNRVKESIEAIDKSPMFKEYRIQEAPLSTRSCPDHAGALLARVGAAMDGSSVWQCQLDKRTYNFNTGFTNEKGDKIPGGEVQEQTPKYHTQPHAIFDTREDRLTGYTPTK
jgi:hypothetical protein